MIGNIGPWQLLILLVIVVLVFGTKRLRNLGGDLGTAVRGFRKGMNEDEDEAPREEELSGGALGSDVPGKTSESRQQAEAADKKD